MADIDGMKKICTIRKKRAALTLLELLVIILIVSILAAALVPILQGRVHNAKWAEARTAASMIRGAVKLYYARKGVVVKGGLDDVAVLNALSIEAGDLTGTCFVASNYMIDDVDDKGVATITVTGSLPKAPPGSRTLYPNGEWKESTD